MAPVMAASIPVSGWLAGKASLDLALQLRDAHSNFHKDVPDGSAVPA
jgi:hypothetical protein